MFIGHFFVPTGRPRIARAVRLWYKRKTFCSPNDGDPARNLKLEKRRPFGNAVKNSGVGNVSIFDPGWGRSH